MVQPPRNSRLLFILGCTDYRTICAKTERLGGVLAAFIIAVKVQHSGKILCRNVYIKCSNTLVDFQGL